MITRKQLINRSKIDWPDHTGKYPILYGCNIWQGCTHDCTYCYARKIAKRWEPGLDWGRPRPVENAVELAEEEADRLPPGRIIFCSMTDPYQYPGDYYDHDEVWTFVSDVLDRLLCSRHYILILTKSSHIRRNFPKMKGFNNVEVGFTITSLDRNHMEPHACPPADRIEVLMEAKEIWGLKTFVSVEPWIPGVTDPVEIVHSLHLWVDRWIFGPLNYTRVDKSIYNTDLPRLMSLLDGLGARYYIKRDLRRMVGYHDIGDEIKHRKDSDN